MLGCKGLKNYVYEYFQLKGAQDSIHHEYPGILNQMLF